jgi:hypothetical protein
LTATVELKDDTKIAKIRQVLESRGFDLEYDGSRICLKMDCMGITNAVLDFYVLKNSPQQTRARLREKSIKLIRNMMTFLLIR